MAAPRFHRQCLQVALYYQAALFVVEIALQTATVGHLAVHVIGSGAALILVQVYQAEE
jgi:hypothetical protein